MIYYKCKNSFKCFVFKLFVNILWVETNHPYDLAYTQGTELGVGGL
jgi:hypothetical protein